MTRRVVIVENALYDSNFFILPNAFDPVDDALPVIWGLIWERPAGLATNFERDSETGELSFDIDIGEYDEDLFDFHVSIRNLYHEINDGVRVFLEGTIDAVGIHPAPVSYWMSELEIRDRKEVEVTSDSQAVSPPADSS